jgi:nitrite reductase (NO-forming)
MSDQPAVQEAPPPPEGSKRDNWVLVTSAIAAFSMVAAFIAVGIGLRGSDDSESTSASGGAKTVQVTLGEMFIEPASLAVAPGTEVTFEVTNDGTMPHDLKVGGEVGTELLDPGASETFTTTIAEGGEAWCTVPGHKEAGMVMAISLEGAPAGESGGGDSASPAATGATIDAKAEPDADWKPFDPLLEPAPGGTEHEIELVADEVELEVAPGVTQTMWVFNGQFPGPILRGKLGDIFTVTLTNEGEIGHSIDFHASKVAWNDEMRTIQPGESLVYQYEAKHAGFYMYHCGTNPALHHIGNGMFGGVIIDPPNLPPVDHEVVLVQSELYLGAQGKEGDLTKMQNDAWDAVVFNGYWNQYKFAPIRVEKDERVRAWVLDAGPSENSSFHIVGTIFDTVYKEGTILLEPDAREGGAQALDLQPAQGGYVEFTFDEDGFYPIVTHKFSNVGKGALGLFQVGDVELPEGGGGH